EREYQFSKEAERKFRDHYHAVKYSSQITSFSYGRYVRNIVEKSIRTQAMRLIQEDTYDKYDLNGI
ncbi:stage V sporulation protein K, partial [Bacillus mycoides]|nr:stage V sporulation protein K [Bacillus mycoides]